MNKKSMEHNCLHICTEPSHSKLHDQEGEIKIGLVALLVKKKHGLGFFFRFFWTLWVGFGFGYLFILALLPLLCFVAKEKASQVSPCFYLLCCIYV